MIDETATIPDTSTSGEPGQQAEAAGVAAPKKKRGKAGAKAAAAAIEVRIGYKFSDPALLATAFTHVSALKPATRHRADSYQRLEFLGDHVLGLIISDMLYRAYPRADEGELSKRLADLVRKESCADVAKSLGLAAASQFVERNWLERMRKPRRPLRDPKTVLQEWAQSKGLPTPVYREIERTGPHHDPQFRVAVDLPGLVPAEGVGGSKRAAEKVAASVMIEREGVGGGSNDS